MKSGNHILNMIPSLAFDLNLSSKDSQTLLNRFRLEGEGFLTKVLPLLGRAVEQGIENGVFICPTNFSLYRGKKVGKTALCKFLYSLLLQIFDTRGNILSSPSPDALANIRQLCYFFNKVKRDPTSQQIAEAERSFRVTDENLCININIRSLTILNDAKIFLEKLFEDFDPLDIVPRDGPGAVADKRNAYERLQFNVIYRRIHEQYRYYFYYFTNSSDLASRVQSYRMARREEEGTSRYCLVPKDSRGPRGIAIEPAEYQFFQQGLARKMMSLFETSPLTRGRVNFASQQINRDLAHHGSVDGSLATLDLKDASDRVSLDLVRLLFPAKMRDCLLALRTPNIELPSGEILRQKKFASMGSALCFPVESIVFYAITRSALRYAGIRGSTHVYGDDIIVPSSSADLVSDVLEMFGLKVNRQKSFSKGFFRESCGGDYFHGQDVTPVRLRTDSSERSDFAAWCSLADNLFNKGLWATSRYAAKVAGNLFPVYSYDESKSFAGLTQFFTKKRDGIPVHICGAKVPSRWSTTLSRRLHRLPVVFGKTYSGDDDRLLQFRWHTKTNGPEGSTRTFSKRVTGVRLRYI